MKSILLILIATALLYGCSDDQVQTYRAPKEAPAAQSVQAPVQQQAAAPAAAGQFEAELPEGWTELPGSGMRMVSYTIEGTAIDFYLISLSMGDVPSNVNRWRRQVGLPEASAEAINEDVEVLQIDGREVKYIEIYNEEGGSGIIAAIIDFAPTYWYFTAKGTVDELKGHAAEIRSFLNSLNFR
jgi:uncharacterized protein YceK